MKKTIISGFIILFFTTTLIEAEILRVPSEYPTIQGAISNSNDGDTIIVDPGTYHEKINFLGKNITVTGYDPNDPEVVADTIIDADGSGSTVTFVNGESTEAVLTGFTITDGYGTLNTDIEAGIRLYCGGGIYCRLASPTITCNVISGNKGPLIVQGPQSGWRLSIGGGIGAIMANPIISRNIIRDNTAYLGASILVSGDPTIKNNLVYGNSAVMGGGVVMDAGRLTNNTIVRNNTSLWGQGQAGGNVYIMSGDSELAVFNNIICNATSGGGIFWEVERQEGSIRFNNVWNNRLGNYAVADPGTPGLIIYDGDIDKTGTYGNISEDPLFVNLPQNDYHLQTGSACINAGDPNYVPLPGETDIEGKPRIYAFKIDIGAYEYVGYVAPVANAGPDQHTIKQQVVTLDGSGSFFYDPTGQKTFYWHQIAGPEVTLSDPYAMQPTFFVELDGEYRFELVVGDGLNTSEPDEVLILVADNQPPVANAGANKVYPILERIVLDGTGSYDPDPLDRLTYRWVQIEGPIVDLQNANTTTPFFDCNEPGQYTFELIINDGFSDSEPSIVKVTTVDMTVSQKQMSVDFPTGEFFYYPDISGTKVVYSVGPSDDYSWDIKCRDIQTGVVETYGYSGIDTQVKIYGDIVVWSGCPSPTGTRGPECTSIYVRDIFTGRQITLWSHNNRESHSHPAVSSNKVVWLQHIDINKEDDNNWYDTPYDIVGADIADLDNPIYFTIKYNAGFRDPYPVNNYQTDFNDVIDICSNIVVWEGEGDIYGADISNLSDIKKFIICNNPAEQYDPAICGNIVVWTDERNDSGDIYGADISNRKNIKEFVITKKTGLQCQAAIDGNVIVYVDGSVYGGQIQACFLMSDNNVLDIKPSDPIYGVKPAIDGETIVWQDTAGKVYGTSLELAYSTTDGKVKNLTTAKQYDYLQHAINDAQNGDIIVAKSGIYREDINFKGKKIIVKSTDPAHSDVVSATIIKGDSQGAAFYSNEDANSVLSGFIITGANTGVYCSRTSPTITNCRIMNNLRDGVRLTNESNLTISHCIISNNGGSGIEMQAIQSGRLMYYNNATVTNCIIAANEQYGIKGSKPIITNCTIVENLQCGVSAVMPIITNSIIYYNGSYDNDDQIQCYSSEVTYCNIQGGWSGIGNIDTDPCFVSSGYWASANDPNISVEPNDTNAIWIEGDYHLKSQGWHRDTQREVWTWDDVTSLCIDAGNPGSALLEEPISLPIDPNNEWGQNIRINIGAYGGTIQASIPPKGWALTGDLTNDGIVNFQDYGFQLSQSLKVPEDQPGDLNRNDIVDLADIAILAEDWLKQTNWQ